MVGFEQLRAKLLRRPNTPVLVLDERRFGKAEGFAGERIVFAGVLTTVATMDAFGVAIRRAREFLDAQKRKRALKAADVLLANEFGRELRFAVWNALVESELNFWTCSGAYLWAENRARTVGHVIDATNGQEIQAPELPVFHMILGRASEREEIVLAGELDVFLDRSKQNGFHERNPDSFMHYELLTPGAPALQDGKAIRLGTQVRQHLYPVSEETPFWGDWLLLADLAAHLYGRNEVLLEKLRADRLTSGIRDLGWYPGVALGGDLVNALGESVSTAKTRRKR